MEIYYTTQLESYGKQESPLGYIASEQYLDQILVIGQDIDRPTFVTGRLILARKAIPTIYNLKILESCHESLLYKAHVHNLKLRLAPYGVIYKSKDVIIQAKSYEQKVFDIYRYKSSWLLK